MGNQFSCMRVLLSVILFFYIILLSFYPTSYNTAHPFYRIKNENCESNFWFSSAWVVCRMENWVTCKWSFHTWNIFVQTYASKLLNDFFTSLGRFDSLLNSTEQWQAFLHGFISDLLSWAFLLTLFAQFWCQNHPNVQRSVCWMSPASAVGETRGRFQRIVRENFFLGPQNQKPASTSCFHRQVLLWFCIRVSLCCW